RSLSSHPFRFSSRNLYLNFVFSTPRWLNFFRLTDNQETTFAPCQHFASQISNPPGMEQISSLLFRLPPLHNNLFHHADRLQIFHGKLRRHRTHLAKPANLTHRFIQKRGDNSAVP